MELELIEAAFCCIRQANPSMPRGQFGALLGSLIAAGLAQVELLENHDEAGQITKMALKQLRYQCNRHPTDAAADALDL